MLQIQWTGQITDVFFKISFIYLKKKKEKKRGDDERDNFIGVSPAAQGTCASVTELP